METGTRNRIFQLLLFVALLPLLDFGIGTLLDAGFRRTVTGEAGGRLNRALQVRAPVAVLGSSRAFRHYDTAVLGAALGTTVFNTGLQGQDLPFARGVQDLLLQHYSPRLFILSVDPQSIADLKRYARVRTLAPYVDESPVIRDLIYACGPFEPVKYWSRSFRFNDKVLDIARHFGSRDTSANGYVPRRDTAGAEALHRTWPLWAPIERAIEAGPDPRLVALLEDALRGPSKGGSRVVMVTSPRWRPAGAPTEGRERMARLLVETARGAGIPYVAITFDNTPEFRDPALWADVQHLNETGARRFSELLAARLLDLGL